MIKICSVMMGILLLAAIGCNIEPSKIGVVDVVKVTNESKEGKKANTELDTLIKAKRDVVREKAYAIDRLKKNFDKEPALNKKAKDDELNKASVEYQKLVAASDAEVQRKAAELRSKVLGNIKKVVDTIGQEEKFLLIITTENALYFHKHIDLNEKVITKYNELVGEK